MKTTSIFRGAATALVTPLTASGVDYEAFSTACMSSPDAARLYNESRRQTMASANIYNEGVTNWDEEKKLAFLAEHGFNVEKLPFYYDDQMTMISGI